jgi:hypothetical protein
MTEVMARIGGGDFPRRVQFADVVIHAAFYGVCG